MSRDDLFYFILFVFGIIVCLLAGTYAISYVNNDYRDYSCEVVRIYKIKDVERVEIFLEGETDGTLRKNVVFDNSTFYREYTGVCSRFWNKEELHITKADYLALVKKE